MKTWVRPVAVAALSLGAGLSGAGCSLVTVHGSKSGVPLTSEAAQLKGGKLDCLIRTLGWPTSRQIIDAENEIWVYEDTCQSTGEIAVLFVTAVRGEQEKHARLCFKVSLGKCYSPLPSRPPSARQ